MGKGMREGDHGERDEGRAIPIDAGRGLLGRECREGTGEVNAGRGLWGNDAGRGLWGKG